MVATAKVAIIHPWMPQYRVPFFERLRERAAAADIEVVVAHGAAPPEWRDRGDTVDVDWATALRTRALPPRSRPLLYKSLRPLRRAAWDLVVMEQAVRNLETYQFLLRHPRTPVAFWGHGRTYTKHVSALQETAKQWLTRRGTWFFAYTQGGAQAVVAAGFPADRVTVVWNAIDVPTDAPSERPHPGPPTVLVLGALDDTKRLDVVMSAADALRQRVPGLHVALAGDGSGRSAIEAWAQSRSWVSLHGHVTGARKAALLTGARVILNPGRVGLIAADSLAYGVPIVTTAWPFHAPEVEYLDDGETAIVAADEVEMVDGAARLLTDDAAWAVMSAACMRQRHRYSIDAMVDNFLGGLQQALGRQGRPRRTSQVG